MWKYKATELGSFYNISILIARVLLGYYLKLNTDYVVFLLLFNFFLFCFSDSINLFSH